MCAFAWSIGSCPRSTYRCSSAVGFCRCFPAGLARRVLDVWPAQATEQAIESVALCWADLALRRRSRKFGSRVISNSKEVDMAKGQQKGNRETKKPKKEKIKVIAAAPSQKTAGWQPSFGDGKKK